MGYTYEEYLRQLMGQAQKEQAAYEVSRRQQTEADVKEIDRTYNEAKKQATERYTAAAKERAASFRSLFDANAVDELVARREATEAIANSNMANSGLNNTQHTAISLQRSRADSQTRSKRDQAVRSIMHQLDEQQDQYESEAAQKKAALYAQEGEDIRNNLFTLTKNASDRAQALYDKQMEREHEAQEREKERAFEAEQKALEWAYESAKNEKNGSSDPTEEQEEEVESITEQTFDRSKHGTRFAEKGGQSYTAVRADAYNILHRESNNAAWNFLKQRVKLEYITQADMNELMRDLGIERPKIPTDEEIDRTVRSYILKWQRKKAVEYVKSLHDNYLIGIKDAYRYYEKIGMFPEDL